ncbi:MAG TPA: gliding motility-associated C-terminal domain-containing protein, partial [Cytophagaceae bacterium]|nr:gliding motility-associated C-terminal domain-containing protein [Cytophagaceae bacterium]
CNNTSLLSLNTCTVYLTVTRNNEINYLSWNAYIGYQSGISGYVVESLDDNNNVLISKSVGNVFSYSEASDPTLSQIIYRIRVVPVGTENLISYSNIVKLDLTPQIYMPTVFTPNADGDNDILLVKGKYFKSIKMTVLNKWGEVVFISEDVNNGWDGNYKGQPATIDSYAYHVVALDNSGKEITLKGVVSLLR